MHSRGYTVREIHQRLREENCDISAQSLYNLLRKFREKRTIADLSRHRRPRKLTDEMRQVIEEELTNNDEITSTGIRSLLLSRWPDLRVSVATIKRTRREMGWVCTRPHYCQLLREVSVLLNSCNEGICDHSHSSNFRMESPFSNKAMYYIVIK